MNHGWPERIELQSDGNLQCLRMLWALSGIYDLYRSITVFYSREVGRRIERGENVRILAEHLQKLGSGRSSYTDYKRCLNCGYETTEDFVFCPKCGARL